MKTTSNKPQSARGGSYSNARYASRAKAQKKSRWGEILKRVLSGLGAILLAILLLFGKIGTLFKWINRKLDVFRKTEASAVVVNAIVGGIVICLALAAVALCFSGLRVAYGNLLVAFGRYDSAQQIAQTAEKEEGETGRVDALIRRIAAGKIDDGDTDGALALLSQLPATDSEAQQLVNAAREKKGNALYESGDYAQAAQVFSALTHTESGRSRYADCLCVLAVQAYKRGDEDGARQLLMSAGEADKHIESAIRRVSGSEGEAQALISGEFFNPESLRRFETAIQAVREAQNTLPTGKIAAGNKHTVGLKSDGTVVACGDNLYGQLNVDAWRNVTMVAAGAWHTVGLLSDGTVVACGDSSQGQTDVSSWTDIVMIAASEYDTLGLRRDGTVISCGMHNYDTSAWTDVTSVCGGGYSAACLYGQGSMRSTHKGAQMGAGTLISSISVCGAYSVGVRYDGALVSSFEGAPAWDGLVRATASSTGIFAITNEGAVKSHFFRPADDPGINVTGQAVEIASSGTHTVILTSDGRVFAFGLNDYGQTGVSGWQL